MIAQIDISKEKYETLIKHLFHKQTEQASFLFLGQDSNIETTFDVKEIYHCRTEDLEVEHEFYIELTDDARQKVIKKAWDTKTILAEVHSHHSSLGIAQFSPSDLMGFQDFVPHVWWRLKSRPYFAFVFNKKGFDSLVWLSNPDIPSGIVNLNISEKGLFKSSGLTFGGPNKKRSYE